jgi:hypothetical protein
MALHGVLVRLSFAKIEFRSADGATVTTTANDFGEYTVSLDAGLDYTITVTAMGFCPAHRPFVRLNAGRAIKFDFILTTICPGDRIVWGGDKENRDDLYFASSIPYYFEESLALGKNHGRCLIIVFGTRRKGQDLIEYASLPITHDRVVVAVPFQGPGIHLPVTISFDTYTVRSETAVLDRKTRVLEAQRKCFGRGWQRLRADCVVLRDVATRRFGAAPSALPAALGISRRSWL